MKKVKSSMLLSIMALQLELTLAMMLIPRMQRILQNTLLGKRYMTLIKLAQYIRECIS
mgnify:CR=1 FL=1